jgi:hypothetical protein
VNHFCKSVCAIVVLFVCAGMPLFAADGTPAQPAQYGLGDQTLQPSVGLFTPLFLIPTGIWFLAPSSPGGPPHLSLGGAFSIGWAAYVAPQIRIGADLGGSFAVSPNGNFLWSIPLVAKASYVFTLYPFEIPLTFGVGINIVKLVDQVTVDLLLKPGASFLWIFHSSWSFGVNLNYWFDMQFSATAANSRIGNFLETTLTALYHF